jgi:hypothetical protein
MSRRITLTVAAVLVVASLIGVFVSYRQTQTRAEALYHLQRHERLVSYYAAKGLSNPETAAYQTERQLDQLEIVAGKDEVRAEEAKAMTERLGGPGP